MRAALADVAKLAYPQVMILQAGSAARALELARAHWPQLVLLDVALPDGSGIDLVAELCRRAPECRVIVVSQHSAPAYVERALAAGAVAYLTKETVWRELLPILEALRAAGDT